MIRRFWNFETKVDPMIPDQEIPSLTVPRQSLTVKEILQRYVSTGKFETAMGVRYDVRPDINDDEAIDVYGFDRDPDEEFAAYDRLMDFYSSYRRNQTDTAVGPTRPEGTVQAEKLEDVPRETSE